MKTKFNFEDRYADAWPQIRRRAMALMHGRCTNNPFHPAKEVHHLHYAQIDFFTRKVTPIAGHEMPGRDCVPLCDKCHGIAHSSQNWYSDPRNPQLLNRATVGYGRMIKLKFLFWASLFKIPGVSFLFIHWAWLKFVVLAIGAVVVAMAFDLVFIPDIAATVKMIQSLLIQ